MTCDEAAESLPEDDRGALADGRGGHDLERARSALGETEHVTVRGDVRPSSLDRVRTEAGGQRRPGRGERRRCTQTVPAGPGVSALARATWCAVGATTPFLLSFSLMG